MSSDAIPIETPAGFVPAFALGYDDGSGSVTLAGAHTPMPVAATPPTAPDPVEGEALSHRLAGPFEPVPFLPVTLTLAGEWTGSVRLLRSVNAGLTKTPLTLCGMPWAQFSGNVCEQVWVETERGAQLFLEIATDTGSLAYRIAQ